ncbi:MAG: hypothetical protein J1F03_10320 [Oscillospiraceae bacterium]|nr:hypothetical protein [Oscillospiraceae bacterium]
MKSEDFIGLLGDIDSKMIEKASEDLFNWQRSQEGEVVTAGSPRKARWKAVTAVAACAVLAIGAVAVGTRYAGLWGNVATESDDVGASDTQPIDDIVDPPSNDDDRTSAPEKPLDGADLPDPTGGFKTDIKILGDVPEYYPDPPNYEDILAPDESLWSKPRLVLYEENASSWFGVDYSRLGRLHEDWEVLSPKSVYGFLYIEDEIDSEYSGNYALGGHKVIWEVSGKYYNFKDGGYMYDSYPEDYKEGSYDVCVQMEHIGVNSSFDPFDSCPDRSIISYVNGKEAILYHVVDEPNNPLLANIKYGQTIVTISTYDLTEDEFIKIVDEFTSPEYDIEITPWEEVALDHDFEALIEEWRKEREWLRQMNEQHG